MSKHAAHQSSNAPSDTPDLEDAPSASKTSGAHAGGFSYKGDTEGDYPDALQSLEPQDKPPLLAHDDSLARDIDKDLVRGRHGSEKVPAYQHKSRRLRRTLIVVIIILAILLIAAGVATAILVKTASETAVQVAANSTQDATNDLTQSADDSSSSTSEKLISAPDLVSLLGMTQDQATEEIGRGATLTATRESSDEDSAVSTSISLALTEEPADSLSGTPTVYLGLNEEGVVVQAGYSASTTSLGYGSLSFADVISNEHVVEQTLAEAGIEVEEGSVVLPEDKTEYSTYDSDGTTLVRETCSFSGEVLVGEQSLSWSATLSYDYTTANATDNLANTIRLIYVYVNA